MELFTYEQLLLELAKYSKLAEYIRAGCIDIAQYQGEWVFNGIAYSNTPMVRPDYTAFRIYLSTTTKACQSNLTCGYKFYRYNTRYYKICNWCSLHEILKTVDEVTKRPNSSFIKKYPVNKHLILSPRERDIKLKGKYIYHHAEDIETSRVKRSQDLLRSIGF